MYDVQTLPALHVLYLMHSPSPLSLYLTTGISGNSPSVTSRNLPTRPSIRPPGRPVITASLPADGRVMHRRVGPSNNWRTASPTNRHSGLGLGLGCGHWAACSGGPGVRSFVGCLRKPLLDHIEYWQVSEGRKKMTN